MIFLRNLLLIAFLLIFAGCGSLHEDRPIQPLPPEEVTTSPHPDDDLPLLPRETDRDRWEQDSGLPPRAETTPARRDDQAAGNQTSRGALKTVGPDDLENLFQSHKGKVLLVNFWGIDCGPCVAELPHLSRIQKIYGDKGLKVVAISSDPSSRHSEIAEFVRKEDYAFDVFLKKPGSDTKFRGAVDSEYGADPFTVIFDKQGRKLATVSDALNYDQWSKVVQAAVEGRPIPVTDPDIIRLY